MVLCLCGGISNRAKGGDEVTQQAKVGSVDKLALTTMGVIAWNPHRDFAELLNAYCGPKAD